jgi:two-component system, NarL family, nitrate/nitrite response regulator NarL
MADAEKLNRKLQTVRILIADDHPIFRSALRALLESEPDFVVIGESSDGGEALSAAIDLKPDVLLLDLNMPRVNGLQALKEIATSGIPVRTIVLAADIEKPQILEALLLGAKGFLTKDTATILFYKAIRTVMRGQYWVGRDSVNEIIDTLREIALSVRSQRRSDNFGLTPRELEIVRALGGGETNKEIGRRLSISEQTVKHHLTNIFNKVGVSQRLELALFALSQNLVETTRPERMNRASYPDTYIGRSAANVTDEDSALSLKFAPNAVKS